MIIKKRNFIVCILLSIVTCGIYGLYWAYKMTDEVAFLSKRFDLSGGKFILFSIITCGIYTFIWAYKMGNAIGEIARAHDRPTEDKGVFYVILSLFGLVIVDYCLIQDELNNYAED